jgi:transcriptional regulator with XRE-family HTH domain
MTNKNEIAKGRRASYKSTALSRMVDGAIKEGLATNRSALANAAGLSPSTITSLCAGRANRPSMRVIKGLATACGLTPEDVLKAWSKSMCLKAGK